MTDKLETYNILNNIKPHFKKTRYPYNYWSPDKIIFTRNKIHLIMTKNKQVFHNRNKKKTFRGGGELYNDSYIFIV